MLKRLTVVVLAALALGGALSGCDRVDPNSPLGKRKVIFKDMLKTSEDLGGMLRGRLPFDGVKFADGALKLDGLRVSVCVFLYVYISQCLCLSLCVSLCVCPSQFVSLCVSLCVSLDKQREKH